MRRGRGEQVWHRAGLRRILAMEVVSGLGDGVFWVALIAALLDRGFGPAGLALAAAARLGPRAVIGAPAGVLVDRVDRRRMLVALDLGRAVLMAGLAAVEAAGAGPAALLGVVLAAYTLAAPYRPAVTAAMPLVVGERHLAEANALVGTVRQLMTFVGPVVGAALLALSSSPTIGFAVNAASFAVSAALLAGVHGLTGRGRRGAISLAAERRAWTRELAEGWREVRSPAAGLLVVVVLIAVMYATRGLELVVLVLVADQRLGLGAEGVGVLSAAVGLGALVVLRWAGRVAAIGSPAPVMTLAVAANAVPLAALGVIGTPVLACLVLVVLGAGVVVFEVASVVVLQRLSRLDTLGRVFGIAHAVSNGGKLLGALVAPVLVRGFGLGGALAAAGACLGAVAVGSVPALVRLGRAAATRRELLQPRVAALAALGVFESASVPALERVAASLTPEHLPAGTVVVRQGDPADDLFVVRDGEFTVHHGDRQINIVGPGDWFGEIGLLRALPRTATVTSATPAEVWRIPGQVFLLALQEAAAPPGALLDGIEDRLARSRAATGNV